MLIYNYQKEFLGIDETDLKALGFKNLFELRSESADFADLFVKTPGFVHNFKHVHWIDFISCAQSLEDAKVIINVKSKNYRCNIKITTLYLVDNPSQKAYAINLLNLRELSAQESDQIAQDVLQRPTPQTTTAKKAIFKNQNLDDLPEKGQENTTAMTYTVTHDPYEAETESPLRVDNYDAPATKKEVPLVSITEAPKKLEKTLNDFVTEKEVKLDVDLDVHEEPKEKAKIAPRPTPSKTILPKIANIDKAYVYDPQVASNELGLPVDLIEEFISDFIAQAQEFKETLYTSLNSANMDNVKVFSHKLKGVAANLRIEDAFEALTIVNTSSNIQDITTNLDRFYTIIAKLSGESTESTPVETLSTPSLEKEEEDDDIFALEFKDEGQDKIIPIEMDEDFKIDIAETQDEEEDLFDQNSVDTPSLDLMDLDFDNDETSSKSPLPEIIDVDLDLDGDGEPKKPQEKKPTITETLYDKNSIAHEIGIDRESFDALFEDFMEESVDLCALIGSAIAQEDPQTWKKGAIKLKGMSENMRIHDFLTQLNTLIDTKDAKLAQQTLEKINTLLIQISKI